MENNKRIKTQTKINKRTKTQGKTQQKQTGLIRRRAFLEGFWVTHNRDTQQSEYKLLDFCLNSCLTRNRTLKCPTTSAFKPATACTALGFRRGGGLVSAACRYEGGGPQHPALAPP